MKKLKLGIDIDGVLADFNKPYVQLLESIQHIRFPDVDETYPDTWDYDKARGVLGKHRSEAWTKIKESHDFWYRLPSLTGAEEFLGHLADFPTSVDTYFVTSRPGLTSKIQTEQWLGERGYENPTVLISSQKGMCARALELDYYIDDKDENCVDVVAYSPTTKCVQLIQPWNHRQEGAQRVGTLKEFQTLIELELV